MKTNEQLLADFKRSNKERRLKIAQKAGFTTTEDYILSLTSVKSTKKESRKPSKKSKPKGLFYVVDVLDASGSMDNGKYSNSVEGIKAGIQDLCNRDDVKYSLVEFIQGGKALNNAVVLQKPKDINVQLIPFNGATGRDTPLYYTVYNVINDLKAKINPEDKVLIKVYTDGENNTLYEFQRKAAQLIEQVQKENFTVTFVATPRDLERIIRDINLDKSNTLATENTPQGFKMSMARSRVATSAYFASADAGESVLTGFYKENGTL